LIVLYLILWICVIILYFVSFVLYPFSLSLWFSLISYIIVCLLNLFSVSLILIISLSHSPSHLVSFSHSHSFIILLFHYLILLFHSLILSFCFMFHVSCFIHSHMILMSSLFQKLIIDGKVYVFRTSEEDKPPDCFLQAGDTLTEIGAIRKKVLFSQELRKEDRKRIKSSASQAESERKRHKYGFCSFSCLSFFFFVFL
jgi:hypothetical protein